MFDQTHTARKPPTVCAPVTRHPRLWRKGVCLQRIAYVMPHNALLMEMTQQIFRFFLSLVTLPLTLTFKIVWARDQSCLPFKFGTNPFSRSRDIWVTNKMTNKQKSHRQR